MEILKEDYKDMHFAVEYCLEQVVEPSPSLATLPSTKRLELVMVLAKYVNFFEKEHAKFMESEKVL